MEHRNKTKEERFQLIVEMSYTLLRFLTEKNLLSEFLDECYVPSNYPDVNKIDIVSAFPWKDVDAYRWAMTQLEFERYNVNTKLRMKEILDRR